MTTSRSTKRDIPIDVDAERALVGAMLLLGSSEPGMIDWDIPGVRSLIGPEAFTDPDCRRVFSVIVEADQSGEPIDCIMIKPRLDARGKPSDGHDWTAACLALCESVPSAAHGFFYARAVRRAWQLREIIRVVQVAGSDARAPQADPNDLVGALWTALERIDEASHVDREPQREVDLIRAIDNPNEHFVEKVPVALGDFGLRLNGGLECGSLTVIGARPSCGKTSLGLGFCVHASQAADGCRSMFFSLEMSQSQVAQRLMAMRSGLAVQHIRSGDIGVDEFNGARNRASMKAAEGRTVFVLDGVKNTRAIAALARRYVRRHEVRLVVIDYLGLCELHGSFERHDLRIGAMCGIFKTLAMQTSTAIVLLEQLNRSAERENRRPRLSDLRDCGRIEADADNVILIQKGRDARGDYCDTTLILAKQRQGNTGEAIVSYHRPTMAFEAKAFNTESNSSQSA